MVNNNRVHGMAFALGAGLMIVTSVGFASATTAPNPVNASIIHGIQWANVTDTGFTVAWITDAAIPGSGSVIYGLSPSTAFTAVAESPPPAGARGDIHAVRLTNLTASTTYYVAVAAGGAADKNG